VEGVDLFEVVKIKEQETQLARLAGRPRALSPSDLAFKGREEIALVMKARSGIDVGKTFSTVEAASVCDWRRSPGRKFLELSQQVNGEYVFAAREDHQ
jgi:hypothetical protein